jgi:hypothetical protein
MVRPLNEAISGSWVTNTIVLPWFWFKSCKRAIILYELRESRLPVASSARIMTG